MAYTRKFKKGLKSLPKKAYKKVYGSRTIPQAISSTGKVARDVLALSKTVGMIASRLNVEKKTQSVDVISAQVGQVNNNIDGNLLLDVTPAIIQRVDSNQRIGNSLKLTGMNFPIQFSGQPNTGGNRRLRVHLFKVLSADNGVTAQEAFNDYYDINPLNGLRDMNAPRKYRTAKQDGIKLLRTKYYNLKAPQYSLAGDVDRQSISVNFAIKMDEVLRYDSSANTSPDGTRYFLVIQCEAGNYGAG
uniref:hypothetical protein n=1 Tax=Shewanella sp. TaxID=50422 RepID=UPI0040479DFA